MKGLEEAATALASISRQRPPSDIRFSPLTPVEPGPAAAVDGSSAVVADTGSAWVVAFRAQAVGWPGPPPLQGPVELVAVAPDEGPEHVARRYQDHGLEAPRVHGAEAMAEALRDLLEMQAAIDAVREGVPFLYLDGALDDLPPGPQALADRIKERADGRTTLVGVSKRSRLALDGRPVIPALAAAGPTGAWAVTLPSGIHVARLHARSPHVFRIDGPEECLPVLAAHARDAVYLGYPYPLALAHNTVAITGDEVARIRNELAARLAGQGAPSAMTLLEDFHDVLDRNVP